MGTASTERDVEEALRQELRRGTLVLAVLATLTADDSFGSEIQARLNDAGVTIDTGALYPMLRRLEGQGLLQSEWRTGSARNRRHYRTTAQGIALLQTLMSELEDMSTNLRALMDKP